MAHQTILSIHSNGPGLTEFTGPVEQFVSGCSLDRGLLTVFVRHTSCSLIIQENADPDVQTDLQDFFSRLVPAGDDPAMHWLRHTDEGPDDMPAHVKAALTQTSLAIPIDRGRMLLGTWQGIYLWEHRTHPHNRQIVGHLIGD